MSVAPILRTRLQQLLADYGAKVRRIIENQGLGQYGIDPADIEQEVRIRLWRALERDRNAAFHTSYIQRVVLSSVIDAIRAANSRPVEPLPDEAEEGHMVLVEPGVGPERNAGAEQDFGRIAACLAELPERRREAVTLHLQGYTPREIGQRSGMSEEAARKLMERGMETLRARLVELGFGEFDE